jgi:hypothetical protein
MKKHATPFLYPVLAIALCAMPAKAAPVSAGSISGPIAATVSPGAPSHNYPFFLSNHDLPTHGYVEEEFFIKGAANTYDTPDMTTATFKDGDHPYLTRIVVRRPANAAHFNGTVLVEWYNVTNQFDAENVWFFDWEHMMRAGYAWVGVSAQTVGVNALHKWSPDRYGTLDVANHGASDAAGAARPDPDAMSYDIFSQVGQAIRQPGGIDVLHGLKPKRILAVGESQSAGRLATYANSIQPLANVYDGFLLLSAVGRKIRTDLAVPIFKLSTEYDVASGDAAVRQPDTKNFRAWEVAGTSHVDQHLRASREPLELRDNGNSLEAAMAPQCEIPEIGTRVPTRYVVASALDKLTVWSQGGSKPSSAPPLEMAKINPRPAESLVARDANGLAQGGIRLAEIAVPAQVNNGLGHPSHAATQSGIQGEAIGAGACVRWGYSTDFTVGKLDSLYPTHADYVSQVRKATQAALKAGYILPFDADTTIHEAEASRIGAR